MQNQIESIPDFLWLSNYFKDYSNPKSKIEQYVKNKKLLRLKRGRYLRADLSTRPGYLAKAANALYGPSYISFSYALRWHGIIPEHVAHITSATFRKNRKKRIDTVICSFLYQDVPEDVYPVGLSFGFQDEQRFLMAGPEKALCDQLYIERGVRTLSGIEDLLFDNLRIDESSLYGMDIEFLKNLSVRYGTQTLNIFSKYLYRINNERAGKTTI